MEAKQKRRYSCRSWHVAAKVVIKPEVDEDDITTETNIDDFVTALEDCQEESDEENLETCYEDLSETMTETLCCDESDHHSTKQLPRTGEEIINMCDLVQERLRKSLLLDDLPHDISCQQDIEAVNEMIHQTEQLSRSKQNIKIPNWDVKHSPSVDISEASRTLLKSDTQSSKTFQNIRRTHDETDMSSSETICIDDTMSNDDETSIVDSPSTQTIMVDNDSVSTTLQLETTSTSNDDTFLKKHIDTTVTDDSSTNTMIVDNSKYERDKSAKVIINKYDDISVTQTIQEDSWSETSVISQESNVTEDISQGRRGNSHLFSKIKQRYERSTCDSPSLTQHPSPCQDRPKKVLKEPNFASAISVPRYQNIPISKVNGSTGLQKSKIEDKLTILYDEKSTNDTKVAEGQQREIHKYTTVDKPKSNNVHDHGPHNRAATVIKKTENVLEDNKIQPTKKVDQPASAQIKNGGLKNESNNQDSNKELQPKKTLDPHIYEEVSPCSSFEADCVSKEQENIYAEIKSETPMGMIEPNLTHLHIMIIII